MSGKTTISPEQRAKRIERRKATMAALKKEYAPPTPEEKAERRRAIMRRCADDRKRREAAEMILAKATVRAHRIIGKAIEQAREAGIADPQALVASYIQEIAAARAAEDARYAAMQAAAEEQGVDPAAVQAAYVAATPRPRPQQRRSRNGGEK